MPTSPVRLRQRESASDVEPGGCHVARRRSLRRHSHSSNAMQHDATPYRRPANDGGSLSRALSETRMRLATPVPRPGAAAPRETLFTVPTEQQLNAGLRYLDQVAAGEGPDPGFDSNGDDDDEEAVAPFSYSRMVSCMRVRGPNGDPAAAAALQQWEQAPILNASCADLNRFLAPGRDPAAAVDVFSAQMLRREATNDLVNQGGEMVESEVRRLMAESAYVALRARFADPDARCPHASKKLRNFIRTFEDKTLRHDAMRAMNSRIDPQSALGFSREQLVYQSISEPCGAVGLRDLAALVWHAIQEAPVDAPGREALRSLLLYNLADCARENDFVCLNGTFQRLLAPLDTVYPGVRTMRRTPYEVVQQVSLQWREAIAAGERGDTAEDWQAYEAACKRLADVYFEPDMPLYEVVERQMTGAMAAYREALTKDTPG